jgi:hypothetical protein
MIRFQNGMPMAIWYSQHSYGAAYTFECVEKVGSRPVVFSARGSHANYAISGGHDMHNFGMFSSKESRRAQVEIQQMRGYLPT